MISRSLLRRATKRLGQSSVSGIHSVAMDGKRFTEIRPFELATMILSALEFRKHNGPIHLSVDLKAHRFFEDNGIADIYDEVVAVPLHPEINKEVFWAHSKIASLQEFKAPCAVVDIDCVLSRKLSFIPDAIALHTEPLEFGTYGYNKLWDFLNISNQWRPMLKPYNTAVLCFNDDEFRRSYVESSLGVMQDGSKLAKEESKADTRSPDSGYWDRPIKEIIFAEQMMLSIVEYDKGYHVSTLSDYDAKLNHMRFEKDVMHLWNSKLFMTQHQRAQERYMNWVMERIFSHHKSELWGVVAAAIHKCGLPTVRVTEANCDKNSVRWGYSGEWCGPGETSIVI